MPLLSTNKIYDTPWASHQIRKIVGGAHYRAHSKNENKKQISWDLCLSTCHGDNVFYSFTPKLRCGGWMIFRLIRKKCSASAPQPFTSCRKPYPLSPCLGYNLDAYKNVDYHCLTTHESWLSYSRTGKWQCYCLGSIQWHASWALSLLLQTPNELFASGHDKCNWQGSIVITVNSLLKLACTFIDPFSLE